MNIYELIEKLQQYILDSLWENKRMFSTEDDFDAACCVVEKSIKTLLERYNRKR